MRLLKVLSFSIAALAVSATSAAPLTAKEVLSQFNAVVKTTFTSKHDVEGRLVAGTITGGATFYNHPRGAASQFSAVNANNITGNFTANVNNGGGVNYTNSNSAHFNLNGGGSVKHNVPTFDMADFTKPLDALASLYTGLSKNSDFNSSDFNDFKFNVSASAKSTTAVFNVAGDDANRMFQASNISFEGLGKNTTVIVNVFGKSFAQGGASNFNGNEFINTHVIWNFVDATSLSFKYWHGTVLAGNAAVTNSSPIEGTLYANSFVGGGELHDFHMASLPIPEPHTYAMMFVGLGLVGFMSRRKKQTVFKQK